MSAGRGTLRLAQYRSAIFYHTPQQQTASRWAKETLAQSGLFEKPVVTQIEQATEFYPAEDYHQKYLKKNPNGYCDIQLQSGKIKDILRMARQEKSAH